MRVRFHVHARREMHKEFDYYERRELGLGMDFLSDVQSCVAEIKGAPLMRKEIAPEIRRYRCSRFPFALIYRVRGEEIVIVAVAHSKRKPRYWARRMPD